MPSLEEFKELKLHIEINVPVILRSLPSAHRRPEDWTPEDFGSKAEASPGCDRFNNCIADAQLVQLLNGDDENVIGYALMSPLSSTTLPLASRRALGIPETAVEYAFLYPAKANYKLEPGHDKPATRDAHARALLLKNGGFV